jgi:hypothetical protein
MKENLSPIVHQYTSNLYRVPLCKQENHYKMYVGDGYTREFDENSLPDEIKIKMAMILARSKQVMYDHELTHLRLMSTIKDDDLAEIGWQASESMFIVVMPITSLMKLRGEEHEGND